MRTSIGSRLQQQILADAAGKIHRDTLLVVDPTDIRKPYAQVMPHLAAGGEKKTHIEYGFRKVRLPGRRGEELTLVVIRGFGEEPLLLLTNVEVRATRCSVWAVVSGYLTRWLVEETIRFIKQSYRLEDMRVLDYQRLKNLTVLALATAYFCASWLGERLKLSVLVTRVTGVAKRFFGVPEFHYYALADGIRVLLSRLGTWSAQRGLAVREASAAQPWLFHFP